MKVAFYLSRLIYLYHDLESKNILLKILLLKNDSSFTCFGGDRGDMVAISKAISPPLNAQNYLKFLRGGDRGDIFVIFLF